MNGGWQPIVTAPKNDERILVSGGTWIRGNKQQLAQSFPCLVIWDERVAYLRQRGTAGAY
jgi:hypothetical protein